jgi:hypothetical protein
MFLLINKSILCYINTILYYCQVRGRTASEHASLGFPHCRLARCIVSGLWHRRRACVVDIGPATLSSGLLRRRWACVVVIGPAMSSFSSLRRRWGLCRRCWASGIVVGLVSSSLGLCHRRWACHVGVKLTASSLGLYRNCWACHVVVQLAASLLGLYHRRCRSLLKELWTGRPAGGREMMQTSERTSWVPLC